MLKTKLLAALLGAGLLLHASSKSFAQANGGINVPENPSLSNKEKRKIRPTYIRVNGLINESTFRDFATSPLNYKGLAVDYYVGRLRMDSYRESEISLGASSGNYSADFNGTSSVSKLTKFEAFYSKLYRIDKLTSINKGINTKAGFLIDATGDLRYNTDLQNNARGLEFFGNAMGSVKITKDLSNKAKNKNRDLSLRLNVGLVNATLRNGFAYLGQGDVTNDPKFLDGYEFKMFSGFRMGTRLDYTRYLKNKNAVQISYIWDAYKTGGDLDKFELAHHKIGISLLFNTNNR